MESIEDNLKKEKMVIYWTHTKKRGKHKGSNDLDSRREKKEGQAKGNLVKDGQADMKYSVRPKRKL